MTLGIFLALGDSFENLKKSGQDESFKKFYIKTFAEKFDKVYIFTYSKENITNLPKNVITVSPKKKIHRYLYGLLIPFIHGRKLRECDVIRAYHLTGSLPAIISKIFFSKPFMFNYAYDYLKFAKIEKKIFQLALFYIFKPVATRMASGIFAANKELERELPKGKTFYLPNGTNASIFKPIKKSRGSEIKNILGVGRLEKQKNFENLIIALVGLNVKLIIVGKGSLKPKLKSLAKKMDVSLKIITRVKHFQMPFLYRNADIFVSASLMEGSPKALLEAMSSGLPIVATNVEGNKELVNNEINGLLCETSAESIHDSISRLIRDKKKATRLGKRARLTVENEYNLENLLRKEVNVLQQLSRND